MNINKYDFGKIEIEGAIYTSDVIVSMERVQDGWWRKEGHSLCVEDLDAVLAAGPDILVIGTGYYGRMSVPSETRAYLASKGIEIRQSRTADAVKEFNRLQRDYSRVVAALHLTC